MCAAFSKIGFKVPSRDPFVYIQTNSVHEQAPELLDEWLSKITTLSCLEHKMVSRFGDFLEHQKLRIKLFVFKAADGTFHSAENFTSNQIQEIQLLILGELPILAQINCVLIHF